AEPERVSCEMTRVGTTRSEDNFSALLRMRDGPIVAVAGSRATATRSGAIELTGAGGILIADHVLNTAELVVGTTATPLPLSPPVPTVREVLADFVAAVQRRAP